MATKGVEGENIAIIAPTGTTFTITYTKLYVPVVTLSAENDNKLLQQLKTGFKTTIKWNKYTSEMTNQAKTNNLNYLIDPTFSKVNRLWLLWLMAKVFWCPNKEQRRNIWKNYWNG